MSVFITVEELHARLPELLEQMHGGQEFLVTQNDHVVARLIRSPKRSTEPRKLGTMKGTVLYIAPDFDAPMEFKESTE